MGIDPSGMDDDNDDDGAWQGEGCGSSVAHIESTKEVGKGICAKGCRNSGSGRVNRHRG